jgi:hypothetical protein
MSRMGVEVFVGDGGADFRLRDRPFVVAGIFGADGVVRAGGDRISEFSEWMELGTTDVTDRGNGKINAGFAQSKLVPWCHLAEFLFLDS